MRYADRSAEFPDEYGVYVVYESATARRPLYVGKAQTQTIRQRWIRNHLKNRAGGSAFSRSLGPHLALVDCKLSITRDGRYYPREVEREITETLHSYFVEWHTTATGEETSTQERKLIRDLDPILNVQR